MRPPQRHKKADRLTWPHSSGDEIACDHALGPVDHVAREMDAKWGIDRLPDLVSVETATRFGVAVGALNAAVEARDVDATRQNAENVIRAYRFLDAEAERLGSPKADTRVWEVNVDGVNVGIMADGVAWQPIKSLRPDLLLYSMREVAMALKAYGFTGEVMKAVKEEFPNSKVTTIKPKVPANYDAELDDEIPF